VTRHPVFVGHTVKPGAGDIDQVIPCWGSFLSETSFFVDRVRLTAYQDAFKTWLPVWINDQHGRRAAPLMLAQAARLHQGKAFPVLPHRVPVPACCLGLVENLCTVIVKAMNATVVSMMSGTMHESVVALEGYFSLYHTLISLDQVLPDTVARLRSKVARFARHPGNRGKDVTPSLGELLPLVPLSGISWSEAVVAVLEEAFTRNARWALKAHPDLATMRQELYQAGSPACSQRLRKTFSASLVSLKLLCFHCMAARLILEDCGTDDAKCQQELLGERFGRPCTHTVDSMLGKVKRIRQLASWEQFFAGVSLPCPSPAYLSRWLRRSVLISQQQGYHNQRRAEHLAYRNMCEREEQREERARRAKGGCYDEAYDDY